MFCFLFCFLKKAQVTSSPSLFISTRPFSNTLSFVILFLHLSSKGKGIWSAWARLIRIYGRAAAQLYALDPFLPGAGRLTRAEKSVRDGAEGFGFARRAGLKDVPVLVVVPRDVEGVALSVTEAVDDGAAQAALLADGLLQRLRLAPVQPQVATLRDVQRLLAGLQHLVGGGHGPCSAGN